MSGHIAVVDLGYGDAGKGTVVDALCATRPVRAVIRFNGGAQAGHNVVTPDGRHHTFAQFGSGSFAGVPTHLSRFVVVDPLALAAEAAALHPLLRGDPFALLSVDERALLATPWHRAANQARERRRGRARHGSCGMGVGETVGYALDHPDAPRAGDVASPGLLRRRLCAVRDRLTAVHGPLDAPPVDDVVAAFTAFGRAVAVVDPGWVGRALADGPCVFEGAQGVLLDEWRGWHPYTTWSTTTFDNVAALCDDGFLRLGVVRTLTTRHGPGPLVTEADLPSAEPHNRTGRWQGRFRVGHFDAVAHRYAIEVAGGVDALALTHLDAPPIAPGMRICPSYDSDGTRVDRIAPGPFRDLAHQADLTATLGRARPSGLYRPADWAGAVAAELDAPVVLESRGPRTTDKVVRDLVRA